MRAVILAAGLGGRLGNRTASIPKPLVNINGRPIVAYSIEALEEAGVSEIVVVTGYREDQVRAELVRHASVPLRFVSNPDFRQGAILSLAAARPSCDAEPFLLVMSDHLIEADLVCRLLDGAAANPGVTVAADAGPRPEEYVDEATRLNVEPATNIVTGIGKGLQPFTHLDAGAFFCTPEVWLHMPGMPPSATLSDVFLRLVEQRRFFAADVSGAFWYDVDTPADYEAAEALLRQRPIALA